jgi:hypothetical protein
MASQLARVLDGFDSLTNAQLKLGGTAVEPLLIVTNFRSFLTRAYPTMKHHNPYIPIMIREAMGIEPRVYARYEYGRERMADLTGISRLSFATQKHAYGN